MISMEKRNLNQLAYSSILWKAYMYVHILQLMKTYSKRLSHNDKNL